MEGEGPTLVISQGNNFKTCLRMQAQKNWTTFTFSWCSWATISLIYTLLLLNENPKKKLTDYLRNLMLAGTTNLRFSDVFRGHRRIKTQFLFNISNELFCFLNKLSEITASIITVTIILSKWYYQLKAINY